MKKAKSQIYRFALLLMIQAGIYSLGIACAHAGEPSYGGKPLSEWLYQLKLKDIGASEEDTQAQTLPPEGAIQKIGTDAIPTLLNILGATEGNEVRVLRNLKSQNFRTLFQSGGAPLEDLTEVAVDAFGILGTNAMPAIPRIVKLLHKPETAGAAAQALAQLGPQGITALSNRLSDKDSEIRAAAISAIDEKASLNPDAKARLLVGSLKDPDPINRGNAAMSLQGKAPDLVIPALIPLLDDKDFYVVVHAARALGSFGAAAKGAIPKIMALYTNAVVQTNTHSARTWGVELMWALEGLDKEAAAKAEVFLVNSGPMNYARIEYTTTLLPDGMELIAGGVVHTQFPAPANRYLASAELYDPVTGKWTETGEMRAARYSHSAKLLSDGKVLVEGGYGSHPPNTDQPALSSKELYDLATGKWTVISK